MFCNNPEYKKFCVQVNNYLPCCDKKDKIGRRDHQSFLGGIDTAGILLQLFELKEILIQKNMIKFYSQGFCMYPCIHPGDVLHIEYKKIDEINIGDIAVYLRNNNLFAHRVIDKAYKQGAYCIRTRPDTSERGSDGPTFSDDIAGVVTGIERKGRIMESGKIECSLMQKIYLEYFVMSIRIKRFIIRNFIYPIAFIQRSLVYKQISKLLFSGINKDLNFSISIPLNGDISSRFNRIVSSEELIKLRDNKDELLKWTIALNAGRRSMASLSFVRQPKDCCFSGWWISEAKIRNIYRGTEIERKIFKKSDELLGVLGAPHVSVSIPKEDYLNRMVFQGLGFKENLECKDEIRISRFNSSNYFMVLERRVKS